MGKSVSPPPAHKQQPSGGASEGLYTPLGTRKYLTRAERQRVMATAASRTDTDLLLLTLAWTGARVSEVLALTPQAFRLDTHTVAIHTLKRRRMVIRELPVPTQLMEALEQRFGLTSAQSSTSTAGRRLWPCCRTTAWRHIRTAMNEAGITGRHACSRGLRHAFGVGTLQAGVPLTLVQRWLGHARLTTTAIYTEVSGPEERSFADRFFTWSEADGR